MNDLYEFGGVCNVIITCPNPMSIAGKQYQKNEPYTILEKADVRFIYQSKERTSGTGQKNLVHDAQSFPNMIAIGGISATSKCLDLLALRANETKLVQKHYECMIEQGRAWLPDCPADGVIFAYDRNLKPLEVIAAHDFQVDFADSVDDMALIFYRVEVDNAHVATSPHIPYLSLQILHQGNTDKQTQPFYLTIPTASIGGSPVLNFTKSGVLETPLVFQVIDTGEKPYFGVM